MMSSSDDQPTITAALLLSKEAPVRLNEFSNDCNETQDLMLVFASLQHFLYKLAGKKYGELNLFELAK